MAAILCKGCDKACIKFGKACDSLCGCCAEGCDGVVNWFEEAFSQPYSCCVTFTFFANFVPLITIAVFLGGSGNVGSLCDKRLDVWAYVILGLFSVNTLFGWYLFNRLNKQDDNYNPNLSESKNEYNRTMKFFLYDPVVACFIVVLIASFVWALLGLSWSTECIFYPPTLLTGCRVGAACMLIFIFVGLAIVGINLFRTSIEEDPCLRCIFCYLFILPCYESPEVRKAKREARVHRKLSRQIAPQSPVSQPHTFSTQQPAYPQPARVPIARTQPVPVAQPVLVAQPAYQNQTQQPLMQPQARQQQQQQQQQQKPSDAEVAKQKAIEAAKAGGAAVSAGLSAGMGALGIGKKK